MANASIEQTAIFRLTVEVTLTGDGPSQTKPLGSVFNLPTPSSGSGTLHITATYSLQGMLEIDTGITGSLGLSIQALTLQLASTPFGPLISYDQTLLSQTWNLGAPTYIPIGLTQTASYTVTYSPSTPNNQPPTINISSSLMTVRLNTASPISGVSITDSDAATYNETITVTLSDTTGLLSATGPGVSGVGTTSLSIIGSLASVNNALATLTDDDSSTANDTITIYANDGRTGGSTGPRTITVTIPSINTNAPPSINAPSTFTVTPSQATSIYPYITIADADAVSAGESITVNISDNYGLLSVDTGAVGGGGSISGYGTHLLTIIGSLSQVKADLTTLMDFDNSSASDTITIAAFDSRNGVAQPQTITVTVSTTSNVPPSINVPEAVIAVVNQAAQVSSISISDSDAATHNETITVTLSDTYGFLSATTSTSGGGGTISGVGTTTLMVSGLLSQVNADLSTLTYTGNTISSDTITINASDGRTNGTAPAKTLPVTVQQQVFPDLEVIQRRGERQLFTHSDPS